MIARHLSGVIGKILRLLGYVILAAALWSVASCIFPFAHRATAHLGGTSSITLIAYPLFGFQSDWSRSYAISDGEVTVRIKAFEDTGWWRGSALFRDKSGAFVIDDGIDYFYFSVCPPEVLRDLPDAPLPPCEASNVSVGKLSNRNSPRSDLLYLGTFYERPDIAFHSWDTYPEPSREQLDAGG